MLKWNSHPQCTAKSVCSILEDIRKAIWYSLQCPVHGVFYIYINNFFFSSEKDEDPKWEELLSHSLRLKYLLAGSNKQCQTKACFQMLFSCITLLCSILNQKLFSYQLHSFILRTLTSVLTVLVKCLHESCCTQAVEKAKIPLIACGGSVQELLQDQRMCLLQGVAQLVLHWF